MPEQLPPVSPSGQPEETPPRQPDNELPVVEGAIDPTSIPDSPQFVDRQTFVSSLSAKVPEFVVEDRLYPNTDILRARAAYEEKVAVLGLIGCGITAAALGVVGIVENRIPESEEAMQELAAFTRSVGWFVFYTGVAISTASTVMATLYRGRAAAIDVEINSFLDGSPSLKPSKKPKHED